MFGDEGEVGQDPSMGGGAGLIGAIVQTGGALYDSYQNRKNSKEMTAMNIAAAKAEAELAYQRSVQQWNAQNLYNSPEAQMARFKAAGLNPHLIYGRGNEGNASGYPQYQPANLQYRIAAPEYGAAFASILPMLMQVGSWMQGMRLTEQQIRKSQVDTSRTEDVVGMMKEKFPVELLKLKRSSENVLSQGDLIHSQGMLTRAKLSELAEEFKYKYGQDLYSGERTPEGGLLRLKFLEQAAQTRLKEAQASWTDMDITNPQALMQLVLGGVMNMAGMHIRQSGRRPATTTHSVTETMRGGRTRTRQRIYQHGR